MQKQPHALGCSSPYPESVVHMVCQYEKGTNHTYCLEMDRVKV